MALAGAARRGLLTLAAIVLFIEEWGWRPLTARAARSPVAASRALEAHIEDLPPQFALVLFMVPAMLLFPIKLFALWLRPWTKPGSA